MKYRKAAGSDNIPVEVLKVDPHAMAVILPLFQDIWQKVKFCKEWKERIIIKVPKKGDLSQCINWQGVTLLVMVSKIFNKILLERLRSHWRKASRRNRLNFITVSCVLIRSIH